MGFILSTETAETGEQYKKQLKTLSVKKGQHFMR